MAPNSFFWKGIILVETQYEIYNIKFSAIIQVFKTWQHILKNYNNKVFFFINYNIIYHFMDTKNLTSSQICLVSKLFCY